jgi:hypothetical protein
MKLAHVHYKNRHIEPVWHVQLAVVVAIGLQIVLSNDLTVGPKLAIAGFETLLLVLLTILKPTLKLGLMKARRSIAVLLIACISAANITSLALVLDDLFRHANAVTGKGLILSALAIYLTNIVIFGLWYWELDSNGIQGQSTDVTPIDFLFPQMRAAIDDPIRESWRPTFFDYVYISITNAVAFSPNDTVPLTHRAKALMALQSGISVITVALVVTRAVTILA